MRATSMFVIVDRRESLEVRGVNNLPIFWWVRFFDSHSRYQGSGAHPGFKVTNCDLEPRPECEVRAARLHGAPCRDAREHPQESGSDPSKHPSGARFRPTPSDACDKRGFSAQNGSTEEQSGQTRQRSPKYPHDAEATIGAAASTWQAPHRFRTRIKEQVSRV